MLCQRPGSRESFQLCIYPPPLLPGTFCCSDSCCHEPCAPQELLPSCPGISFPGEFWCNPTAGAGCRPGSASLTSPQDPSRSSADPGRISPPHSVCRKITAKKGSVARGGGREGGRFLPSKANVSAAEFASTLCLQEHYTTIRIIPNSTAIQRRCKEKHPQNPGRTKEGFPSAPSGNSWDKWLQPEAGEAYFIYLVWGCLWVLGAVPFASSNIQALPERSAFLPAPPGPWETLALHIPVRDGWDAVRIPGKQQAEPIHRLHSPEIKTVSERLVPHRCAAQPPQRSFSRKQKAAENASERLRPGFPAGSVGTEHSTPAGELLQTTASVLILTQARWLFNHNRGQHRCCPRSKRG